MQTGSGKSNAYLVPAKLYPAKTTVVFVPLAALLLDTLEKCRNMGIAAVQWAGASTQPTSIVMVHYHLDPSTRREFSCWLDVFVKREVVSRIVFDEAHLLIDWNEFMQLNPLSCLRGAIPVQLVFMSATLTESIKSAIFRCSLSSQVK